MRDLHKHKYILIMFIKPSQKKIHHDQIKKSKYTPSLIKFYWHAILHKEGKEKKNEDTIHTVDTNQ